MRAAVCVCVAKITCNKVNNCASCAGRMKEVCSGAIASNESRQIQLQFRSKTSSLAAKLTELNFELIWYYLVWSFYIYSRPLNYKPSPYIYPNKIKYKLWRLRSMYFKPTLIHDCLNSHNLTTLPHRYRTYV